MVKLSSFLKNASAKGWTAPANLTLQSLIGLASAGKLPGAIFVLGEWRILMIAVRSLMFWVYNDQADVDPLVQYEMCGALGGRAIYGG